MEQRRPGGVLRYFVVRLGRVVLTAGCVTLSVGASYGQSETSGVSIGVEAIKGMLTGHKQWTFYWDRAPARRPRLGSATADRSPSARLEFMRVGRRLIGHAQDDQVHHAECEFEVTVREGGFTFAGCWGSDKSMIYDPDDREYPFKGHIDGTLLWLAPS
jgi:hypothetical protein